MEADFVGAIDGEIQLRAVVEVGDRDGERLGELLAGSRGCDAADAQALLYALAELPDEDGRSGAGAEAERHAILDEIQGALGS